MTTTELVKTLASRLKLSQKKTRYLFKQTVIVFREYLGDEKGFSLRRFGTFTARRHGERKSYNPALKKFMLLPPRITAIFKPSAALKERFKGVRFTQKPHSK